MRAFVAYLLLTLYVGFADPASAAGPEARIDNASLDAFRASWQLLYRGLRRTERRNLEDAVLRIALASYDSARDIPPKLLSGIGPETIRSQIDGMNYEEILQLAEKSRVTIERRRP